MKKIVFLLMISLFTAILVNSQNITLPITKSTEVQILGGKEYFVHIVKKGHTLYSLSKVYDIPIDEIIFENPEVKEGLFISQILKIPVESRDEVVKETLRNSNFDYYYHVAKEGERFRDLEDIYEVSRRDLQYANSGIYDPLKEGQYVKIPVINRRKAQKEDRRNLINDQLTQSMNARKAEPVIIHTVVAGDNLYRIAKNYGSNIQEIKKLNPALTDQISLGQRILIPKSESTSTFINHTVEKRERLSRIARNYEVDLDKVMDLNPHANEKPYPGQKIKIPVEPNEDVLVPQDSDLNDEVTLVELNQDSLACFMDPSHALNAYKVALMIPLYLEDVDSLKFEENVDPDQFIREKPFRYMQFYYGALMAVDSLRKQGLNVKLKVYDVDAELSKTIKVLQEEELQEVDLIIGPFFSTSFTIASNFAKLFQIPIVNPMSQRSSIIENNPWVYKYQPTHIYHHDQIRNLVNSYYKDSKLFFVKHHNSGFDRTFKPYREQIEDLLIEDFSLSNEMLYELLIEKSLTDTTLVEDLLSYITIEGDTISLDYLEFNLDDSTSIKNDITEIYYATDSIKKFERYASTTRDNVVFTITDNNVFALDVMTQFNILRDTFPTTVVGFPHWIDFENLDNEILMNLNVHTLGSNHLDYQDEELKAFVKDYRKKYSTEPSNYAFTAFDLSWYFLSALMNFGSDFSDCLPYYNPKLIQNNIEFYQKDEKSGFENKHWYLLKYRNYQLHKVNTAPPQEISEDEIFF